MLMIMIKVMRIDDFSVFADLTPDFATELVFGSITSSTSSSVAGPAFGSIAGLILGSINNSASSFVTIPTLGTIADSIVLIVIDLKTTFFYSKQVIAEDYISSKLHMKGTI